MTPVLLLVASVLPGDEPFPDAGTVPAAGTATADPAVPELAAPELAAPDGFTVTKFADDDLARDVFCLTHDSLGRVTVAGRGYVRLLLDTDGDGVADAAEQFADGPADGAQGLYWLGRDLLAVGDGGLLRYRDADRDGRADGPPDRFLKLETGAEHDGHAIRRGPDGWWYLIAGNKAGIDRSYVTRATSPVLNPEQGVLLRFTPDLTGGEVVADGMRNAYDFDFGPLAPGENGPDAGGVYTFDSDGEREVSLPWYRPTRVFDLLPGTNVGWVSQNWKRPGTDWDAPPTVAAFGRGSPTGVEAYRHDAFGPEYRGAVFVADWTFGRVLAVFPGADPGTTAREPVEFLTGTGFTGFAPTDLSVGPSGDLFVSVGGRGTRGGVYRVARDGGRGTRGEQPGSSESPDVEDTPALNPRPPSLVPDDPLAAVLPAHQPLSAWSRAVWEPRAAELGRGPFLAVALDRKGETSRRVRAIEVLTERFGGLSAEETVELVMDDDEAVKARAVWSYGRHHAARPRGRVVGLFLDEPDVPVALAGLGALAGLTEVRDPGFLADKLGVCLGHENRFVRAAAARVVSRLNRPGVDGDQPQGTALVAVATWIKTAGPVARLSFALGWQGRDPRFDPAVFPLALDILESDAAPDVRRDAVRLIQLALGDVGPAEGVAGALESYTPLGDLAEHESEINPFVPRLVALLPDRDPAVDRELVRTAAMLAPYHPGLVEELTGRLTETSHPTADLHHLLAVARLPVERDVAWTERIAAALVRLDRKIAERGMNVDLNWAPRLAELYDALAGGDRILPVAIVEHPEFGRAAHVRYLSRFPAALVPEARAKFAAAAAAPDFIWSDDVVFVLADSDDPAVRDMVRRRADEPAVAGAVRMALARRPEERDRGLFAEGLNSFDLSVVTASLGALETLGPAGDADEVPALVKLMRRLGEETRDRELFARAAALLRRGTGADLPPDAAAWTAFTRDRFPGALSGGEMPPVLDRLDEIDWETGDAARGAVLYAARCARCHGGDRAIGPALTGVAKRFGRRDLFTAIADPNRDVSDRYRPETVLTADGTVVTGMVIYQSTDGVILRDAEDRTLRIEQGEILERRTSDRSLMPTGLLNDLDDGQVADLEAYLREL